jgi:hypothetical protein
MFAYTWRLIDKTFVPFALTQDAGVFAKIAEEAIREELAHILASSHFKMSVRSH